MLQFVTRSLFGLLVLGMASTLSAQELTGTLKKIKETGTITIGHRDSSIPFSYSTRIRKSSATRWTSA